VNVDPVIDEGFIATLNVALTAVLMTTPVAPLAGMVDTTAGTVTVSWPHPAMKTTNRDARKHVIPILNLRMCNLLSDRDGIHHRSSICRLAWPWQIDSVLQEIPIH
jgi:mannose/fructose/N-acetylgalactosamine-specific phosphotransferase system component IIC